MISISVNLIVSLRISVFICLANCGQKNRGISRSFSFLARYKPRLKNAHKLQLGGRQLNYLTMYTGIISSKMKLSEISVMMRVLCNDRFWIRSFRARWFQGM